MLLPTRLLTLLLLFLPGTCVLAQKLVVTGTLATTSGHTPSGNVLVLHPNDSTFISGDFFLDGDFLLEQLPATDLLLRFTSLEFEDHFQLVEYQGKDTIRLGPLTVAPDGVMIDAVVVKGRKPVYQQRPDGTIEISVANTILAASSTTAELLARTPDVQRNEDGELSVIGKGSVVLYLDGQPITSEQLALVAPANIKSIAVIRNPSARYDASGGAVIEITTLRGRDDGYKFRLQQNIGDAKFGGWQSFTSLNLTANRGRFAAQANYNLQTGNDRHVKFTTRDRTDPTTFLSSAVTIDWQPELTAFSNSGRGLQYATGRQGTFSLGYTGLTEKVGGNTFNQNRLEDATGVLDFANTIRRQEVNRNNAI
ncbi:MAG: TonB-dependent receptor plug domain-containing protein, partial [Bacteroidota bacterium]